jgi:hypothetical protein
MTVIVSLKVTEICANHLRLKHDRTRLHDVTISRVKALNRTSWSSPLVMHIAPNAILARQIAMLEICDPIGP